MKRLRKFAEVLAIGIGVLVGVLLLLHLAVRPDPRLADAEQYAVLSAYITPGLTGDSHDLGSRRGTIVILETPTFSSQIVKSTRLRQYLLLMGRTGNPRPTIPQVRRGVLFEFYAQNLRGGTFKPRFELPARYVLATNDEIQTYPSEQFSVRFPSTYGFLTFSRIAFNRDLTEAFFYTEHICGMCGEGKFVFMRKVQGMWVVENTASTWVS